MKVLVACEFSGVVRRAFRAAGHDAWSCDLLPPMDNDPHHLQCDVAGVLDRGWDMMIAHPPCTHLAVSGARWFKDKSAEQRDALDFVRKLLQAPIDRIALENPVSVISTHIRKPDQVIQPWQYGHGEVKATCLWLKGLPKLQPTDIVDGRKAVVHHMPPSPDRWMKRSMTYEGIAAAMAAQWGANHTMDGDPRLQPSGYDRIPKEAYFCFDPVIGDDLIWTFKEIGLSYRGMPVLEPCAGRGDLMRQLRSHGMLVTGCDLYDYPGRDPKIITGVDVLQFTGTPAQMIVTNTPYKSPSTERVAEILLTHAPKQWIALLVPVMWLAAKSDKRRVKLMQGGRLHSITFLGRRPTWVEESIGDPDNAPKQDFVWALWRPAEPRTSKPTIVLWAPAREPITDPFK